MFKKLVALSMALVMAVCVIPIVEYTTDTDLLSVSASAETPTLSQAEYKALKNALVNHDWVIKQGFWANYTAQGKKAIRALQILINYYNDNNELVVDSCFGPACKASVKAIQRDLNCDIDGKVGSETEKALFKAIEAKMNASASNDVKFSSMYFPEQIPLGKGQHISGVPSSEAGISCITAVITNNSGNEVYRTSVTPYKQSYSLYDSVLDHNIPFASLLTSTGDYKLTYYVTSGSNTESYSHSFSVYDPYGKTNGFLSLSASSDYADVWWDETYHPVYGFYASGDCCNYLSALLHAGGLNFDSEWAPHSSAFKGFDNLKRYLYNKYGVVTIMREKYSDCIAHDIIKIKSNLSVSDIKAGDAIITEGNSGMDGHIMWVREVTNGTIYATGHTNPQRKCAVSIGYINGVIKTSALYN